MRRFSYLLLAACFCLPVVGCGGDAAAPASDAAPATETSEADAGSGTTEDASGTTEEAPAE